MNETSKLKRVLIGDDDPELRRACRDKRVYFTRKDAKAAAKKRRGSGGGTARHCYRCQYCEGFHLSSGANGDKWNGKIDNSKEARLAVHRAKKNAAKTGPADSGT